MNRLKPGDKIVCHVKDLRVVSPYASYQEQVTLEIVAFDNTGYFVYVPEYIILGDTTKITKSNAKALNINPKFIECLFLYVPDSAIARVHSVLDGASCNKCKEFCYNAGPNQEDGSFLCYSCRTNPYR